MAHSYKSGYPAGIQIDDGIKQFFEEFYKISDSPNLHDMYADQFTSDAVLIVASKKGEGRQEILNIRKSMWAAIASRQHTAIQIFPFGQGSKEVMLYGTVDYTLKDERKACVDWAARANLVNEGEKWKMGFYQVYLDTAAMQNAK